MAEKKIADQMDALAGEQAAAPEEKPEKKRSKKQAAEASKEAAEGKPAEKTKDEKIAELIEKGKKAGKLTSKELSDVLDSLGLGQEELDAIYDRLEDLGVDTTGDEFLPPLEDDVLPELEELEEIVEVTAEEIANADSMADSFSTDDPVRMYLKEIGKVPLLAWLRATRRPSAAWPRPTCGWWCPSPSAMWAGGCCFWT